MNQFLKYLKLYPIDHHTRATKDCLPEYISRVLSEFIPYMESRMKQTKNLERVTKASLGKKYKSIIENELDFGYE